MDKEHFNKIESQWNSNGVITLENLETFQESLDLDSFILNTTKPIFYFHEMFNPETRGYKTELRKVFANSLSEAVENISKIGSINHIQDIMFLKIRKYGSI